MAMLVKLSRITKMKPKSDTLFGFVFLDSSFGNKLIGVSKEDYIKNSVDNFVNGIIRNL